MSSRTNRILQMAIAKSDKTKMENRIRNLRDFDSEMEKLEEITISLNMGSETNNTLQVSNEIIVKSGKEANIMKSLEKSGTAIIAIPDQDNESEPDEIMTSASEISSGSEYQPHVSSEMEETDEESTISMNMSSEINKILQVANEIIVKSGNEANIKNNLEKSDTAIMEIPNQDNESGLDEMISAGEISSGSEYQAHVKSEIDKTNEESTFSLITSSEAYHTMKVVNEIIVQSNEANMEIFEEPGPAVIEIRSQDNKCRRTSSEVITSDEEILSSGSEYQPDVYYGMEESDEGSNTCDYPDQEIFLLSPIIHRSDVQEPADSTDFSEANVGGHNTQSNIDETITRFGEFVQPPLQNIEGFSNARAWTKRVKCPYCDKDVTHFPRHMIRNHKEKGAVRELMSLSKNDPKRRKLLNNMRRQGNYSSDKIRPVRRPRAQLNDTSVGHHNIEKGRERYVACPDCLGYFSRHYLRRHRKKCEALPASQNTHREQHLSDAQLFSVCSGTHGKFCSKLRLKSEVFPIMRNDLISKVAMGDPLICCYAESLLQKHNRVQIRNTISNKMRELGRLLQTLQEMTGLQRLIDVLQPRFFSNIVAAAKVVCGFDTNTNVYTVPSLALHLGTTLKKVCDIARKMIVEENPMFPCTQRQIVLKEIKLIRELIANHWNSEISSLALKNLNEKRHNTTRLKLLPLTEDVVKFQKFLLNEAKSSCDALREARQIKYFYRRLSECTLALTLLLNRKRIGEIQYLTLKSYSEECSENQQEEFLKSLTEIEKTLTKKFKRVLTQGKGSKTVAILFSPDVQKFVDVLLGARNLCVPENNKYLFANPNTKNGWLSGYHILKKLAEESGVTDKNLFTSTRLRKHIATILQVTNITENEMEQFASFMGHTGETHESYYRLPQDIYQTAKVAKLLIAISKGNSSKYEGKTLDEVELSDIEIVDSGGEEDYRKDIDDACTSNHASGSQSSLITYENDNDRVQVKKQKQKRSRAKWTLEQRRLIKSHFKENLTLKQAPRKKDVVNFMSKYPKLFEETNWVKLKAFVYNCYRK